MQIHLATAAGHRHVRDDTHGAENAIAIKLSICDPADREWSRCDDAYTNSRIHGFETVAVLVSTADGCTANDRCDATSTQNRFPGPRVISRLQSAITATGDIVVHMQAIAIATRRWHSMTTVPGRSAVVHVNDVTALCSADHNTVKPSFVTGLSPPEHAVTHSTADADDIHVAAIAPTRFIAGHASIAKTPTCVKRF